MQAAQMMPRIRQERQYSNFMPFVFGVGAMTAGVAYLKKEEENAECGFTDKNLDGIMQKIQNGVEDLQSKYPDMKQVKINSGLRGVRYFIEFPIITRKFDALALNESTKNLIL